MSAPDSEAYITLTSEEDSGARSLRQTPAGRKGGPLAAVPRRRGLLTHSQAAAQNNAAESASHPRADGVKLSTRARADGRNAGRQRAAALSELQQARAGRFAAAAARPVRQTRARAVVQDSSSDGSGSGGEDSAQPRPPRPRRRATARSRTQFLRGGRDYVESSSDTGAALLCAGSRVAPCAATRLTKMQGRPGIELPACRTRGRPVFRGSPLIPPH